MGRKLLGAEIVEKKLKSIRDKVALSGENLELAVVLTHDHGPSWSYIRMKQKILESVGMWMRVVETGRKEDRIIAEIQKLNKSESIDGIIVQLPLPENVDERRILDAVAPWKDVDGLGSKSDFIPATAKGVISFLEEFDVSLEDKKIVLVGHSALVGQPLKKIFDEKGLDCVVVTKEEGDLEGEVKNADIIITAAGVPGLITGEMVKEGVVVIDVGYTLVDGVSKGDVDFDSVILKGDVSPVPGGVGVMTVVGLVDNLSASVLPYDLV